MESLSSHVYRSIRSYWHRRTYQRLEGSSMPSKKQLRVVRLGGGARGSTNNRRSRKVRPILRLRLKISSPIKLLARLKDAYMDAMLGLAGTRGKLSGMKGQDAMWGRRIPKARQISVGPKDFDQRVMEEIYKSIVASRVLSAV